MRETEGQIEGLALNCRTVTDADELELALVTLRYADDRVRKMRARGARLHAIGLVVLHLEALVRLNDFHATAQRH